MSKGLIAVLVSVLLGISNSVTAATVEWTNDSKKDNLWSNKNNWDLLHPPTASDTALIPLTGADYCLIDSTVTAVSAGISIGWFDGALLRMTGGSLSTGTGSLSAGHAIGTSGTLELQDGIVNCGRLFIGQNGTGTFDMSGGVLNGTLFTGGYNTGSSGIYNHSDGTATYTGQAWLGYNDEFTLNMTGGTINFNAVTDLPRLGNLGHVQLDGGIININDRLYMNRFNSIVPAPGTMDITKGVMIVRNRDWTATFDTYIQNGWITTSLSNGTLVNLYDNTDTWLYAVPEPMTICLLGFGSMFLLRRKK